MATAILRLPTVKARTGLSRTAPAHNHPAGPIPLRCKLVRHGPKRKQKRQGEQLVFSQRIQEGALHAGRLGDDPACRRC